MNCTKCGAAVSYDEAGLNKKLIRRDLTEFLCLKCLSEKLDVPVSRLQEKTEEYRAAGCLLFAQTKQR